MTSAPIVDTDALPPTQHLIMEVLAARYRLGEMLWTFPSRLRSQIEALGRAGLIGSKSGVVEHTMQAWLTDAGKRAALSDTYKPPQPQTHILTWDYRQQPDLDALSRAVAAMSDGTVHVRQVDTGSDEYAIVISTAELDGDATRAAYGRWLHRDNEPEAMA